jgi:hypothetical protein
MSEGLMSEGLGICDSRQGMKEMWLFYCNSHTSQFPVHSFTENTCE